MGYELLRVSTKSCGCIVEEYEHDFFSSRHERHVHVCADCKQKQLEDEEKRRRETEADDARRKEHAAIAKQKQLEDEEKRRREIKARDEHAALVESLERKTLVPIGQAIKKYIKHRKCSSVASARSALCRDKYMSRLLLTEKGVNGRWYCDSARLEAIDFSLFN